MGKVRARRLFVGVLTVAFMAAAALCYFLPRLLERGVPLLAARFGVRSDSFIVKAASPWSVSLGPLRQCYQSRESSLCLIAAAAELRFTWSIVARAAAVEMIRLEDAIITIAPHADPGDSEQAPSGAIALPAAFPNLNIELVRSSRAIKFEPSGRSISLAGELRVSGKEANIALTARESSGFVGKFKGSIVLGDRLLRLNGGELEFAGERLTIEGALRIAETLQLEVKADHPRSAIKATLAGSADSGFASGTMRIDAAIEKFPFSGEMLPLPFLKALVLNSGGLEGRGEFAWGRGAKPPTARLIARELSGAFGPCAFEKLSASVTPLAATMGAASLAVLRCGIELHDLKGELGAHIDRAGSTLRIRGLEAAFLGGRAAISELSVGKELRSSPIELRGISLAGLVALHKQEYIEAEGSIDATIPFMHSPNGFSVIDGVVSSVGGGWIKYHGKPLAPESEQSVLGVTQRALRDYRFTSIVAQIRYATDGTLAIAAQLKGSSPALNTERPVHVNLALEENLLELFKSLRIANDIEQQLHDLR